MHTTKRPVFVNMTDSFMSGWGQVPGNSYYCVKCPDGRTADAIRAAADDRDEMKRVTLSDNPRRARGDDHLAIVQASDLSGPWLNHFPKAICAHLECFAYLPDRTFGEDHNQLCHEHAKEVIQKPRK